MIEYIWKDLLSVLKYLPWGLFIGIPAGLLFGRAGSGKNGGRENRGVRTGRFLYCVYLAVILMITFWSRESGSRTGMDMELFSTWGINKRNNAFVIENILLFIPYGITCCLAFPGLRRFLRCTAAGAVTSLAIESLQLVTKRGYFQIDDILTNTLGAMLGFVLFWLARQLAVRFKR